MAGQHSRTQGVEGAAGAQLHLCCTRQVCEALRGLKAEAVIVTLWRCAAGPEAARCGLAHMQHSVLHAQGTHMGERHVCTRKEVSVTGNHTGRVPLLSPIVQGCTHLCVGC